MIGKRWMGLAELKKWVKRKSGINGMMGVGGIVRKREVGG